MKRLYNHECTKHGIQERLVYEDQTSVQCINKDCSLTAIRSTKPNKSKGRVVGGCDNDKIKG